MTRNWVEPDEVFDFDKCEERDGVLTVEYSIGDGEVFAINPTLNPLCSLKLKGIKYVGRFGSVGTNPLHFLNSEYEREHIRDGIRHIQGSGFFSKPDSPTPFWYPILGGGRITIDLYFVTGNFDANGDFETESTTHFLRVVNNPLAQTNPKCLKLN